MVIRNLYVWIRDLDRVFDAFWWAFFDLVIWGFMSVYFTQVSGRGDVAAATIAGIIFWAVLARSQWEISSSMLLESWEKNLINIFTSPLTVVEFIAASVLLGTGKLIVVFFFMVIVTLVFYSLNFFSLSWWIAPLLANVFLTSIWIALIINALILRFGKRVMSFAWTLALVVNPLSGVVYPLSALPPFLRTIAGFVPTSYVFEGMRSLLVTGSMDVSVLAMSFLLNSCYVLIAGVFYFRTFVKAREHGWLIKLA